ncbi:Potassium channel [Podila horticola]|nr:Potassium channel [Podila horticola]
MWNPPPPDLQLNLANKYSTGRRDIASSNHSNNSNRDLTSPKNSLSQDRAYNLDRHSDHGGDGQVHNYSSGPHLIPAMNRPTVSSLPHPRLEKIAPYLTIATLQAYTVLTVVRCLADPEWIVLQYDDKGEPLVTLSIGRLEKSFLACAIAFTMASCLGVTLRILDKLPWLRKVSVMAAYLEALFCIAAMTSFLSTHTLPPERQFSHGFLACVITVVFSSVVAIMLTIDWYRGFPGAGLSATLKALIISSFVMTIVIIIGAAIYSALEKWSFDDAVNFCIVSFATIGYGNLSPKTSAGQIIFFFYGLLGISSLGFFVVSLRNAVIEQFQWRLVDRFSKPAHLTRVQTRMSAKDISFPAARFEEELQVKIMVKRKMIIRMVFIWIVMWFGGAGIFCAFEKKWTYLESLYFCFVTLTTIGFGDYVPQAPGSIEFWNVYVFVGLAVFAYILSLSSESMASQIHLVDDQDEDDDAHMYGWERNEDPNALLTTQSGILGLEGLKWAQQQQQQPILIGEGEQQDHEDSKQNTTRSLPGVVMDYMGISHDDASAQSSIQRSRLGRKSSSGRILMVSAKERKQMLQAEYYANSSLPTTIRFVDTQGVPHQKVIRRGMSGGTLGSTNESVSGATGDQPGFVYSTVGYYGTVGRGGDGLRRAGSGLRNQQNFSGIGVARHGTMYGAGSNVMNELTEGNQAGVVQTDSLRHQPLIKFDSPKGSVRSAGGERSVQPTPTTDNRAQGIGYIPSCMDVFGGQNKDNGEGPSRPSGSKLAVADSPTARGRSNSWDGSTTQTMGPSQNEIHRWLAEGAGTLEGPSFAYARAQAEELGIDEGFQNDRIRQSQSSDATRVTSPPLAGSSGYKDFPPTAAGLEEYAVLSSTPGVGGRPHHRDGVAPDEIIFMEEPAAMTDEERLLGESDRLNTYASAQVPVSTQPSPPHAFIARIREPTLPRDLDRPLQGPPQTVAESQGLFLGGGSGAGYGTHAYGVPFSPNQIDTFDNMPASPQPQHFVLPLSAPASLFDDDLDHQASIHGSDSRPMSLFSNQYRSNHNSVIGSPVGSRPSSRAPSVLMTIFDEPVSAPNLSRPGSRSVSRSGSLVGGSHSRTGSMFPPSSGATTGLGIGGVDIWTAGSPGSGSGMGSAMHSPETSVGPFDEARDERLQFDDDVDLNKLEMSPEMVQAEYARREDMRRREREVEAQLAKTGSRHHHHQQQQHHGWKGKGRGEPPGS